MSFSEKFCKAIGIDPTVCHGLQVTMHPGHNHIAIDAKLIVILNDDITESLIRYKFTVEEID